MLKLTKFSTEKRLAQLRETGGEKERCILLRIGFVANIRQNDHHQIIASLHCGSICLIDSAHLRKKFPLSNWQLDKSVADTSTS